MVITPKIKTADERIEEAKVATKRVEDAFVEMVVAMDQLRVAIISLAESPVMIELAEEHKGKIDLWDTELALGEALKRNPSPQELSDAGGGELGRRDTE